MTTIWVLVLFYLILGRFLEAMAMMVTTVGVVVPLVVSLGFDPLWFGIFMTIMMEMALITPPVGLNLYVVQNIRLSKEHQRCLPGRAALRHRDAHLRRGADLFS